jgi:RNA methyltransferase, TrmH family
MLSKNKISFIVSLQKKKYREEYGLYIIEGDKLVKEYLAAGMPVRFVIAKPEFLGSLSEDMLRNAETETASYEELKKISTLTTPHNAIALVEMPSGELSAEQMLCEWCLALDCIQDPGNLGTIIRAAAWFGFSNIICSDDSVDVFNSKVIQASMGAVIHVKVLYTDLKKFLQSALDGQVPVYGTVLDGESIYSMNPGNKGVIILGNESKGISADLFPFITNRITIPKYNKSGYGIDSLNVGMAASVILSEFAKRM